MKQKARPPARIFLRSIIDKEQVNGHNHAREEKETPLSGKTQTLAADQTGSPQGECIRSGIEKKIWLMKERSRDVKSARPFYLAIE
jgi:hypothetical protein